MPVIDGNYYGPDDTSWWDDLIGGSSKKQVAPPPSPAPPKVDQDALERSVDPSSVNTLTVHDVGLIVFNETQSFLDHPNANESIDAAREKIAHAVMNGDQLKGFDRPSTAKAIEPSVEALRNPTVRSAYDSSLAAARRAYLNPNDPTQGGTHFGFKPNADQSSQVYSSARPQGVPLMTQSGPYYNSYTTGGRGGVHSNTVYVNTYGRD